MGIWLAIRRAFGPRRQIPDLRETVARLENELAEARKLEKAREDLLAAVTHELRTPLTSISAYTKLIQAGDAGAVTERQGEFLGIVSNSADRLSRLVSDILDAESLKAGHARIERRKEDLASVLSECRSALSVLAEKKGLRLTSQIPRGLKPVLGDRARLVQVFTNLIGNAIQYTQQGEVSIDAQETDFGVAVRIRDTGVGMSAAEQERVFERFYRAPSARESGSGAGLGLAIARGWVEAHGGTIRVESRPGAGSVFTVTLPTVAGGSVAKSSLAEDSAGGLT